MPIIKPGDFDDDRVKALLTRHLEGKHANNDPGVELLGQEPGRAI